MKILKSFLSVVLVLGFFGCATNLASNLEAARFALDKQQWSEAITKATSALDADSTNIEAARILASAYFGRSGLDFLDLAEGLVDLEETSAQTDLRRIAAMLPASADMDDLRSAITTLESLTNITDTTIHDDELAAAAFDLGMMLSIEHFAIGVYASNYKTTLDPSLITEAEKDIIQTDLVNFDNRLMASGLDATESYMTKVRKAICVLSPISAGEGFTLAEYQAWTGCELSDNRDTYDSAQFTADIANCSVINPNNQSAAVEACYDADTSL